MTAIDYRAEAQRLLEQRANVVEQRRALTDSLASAEPSAEQRQSLDRMDADINSLAAEARSIVEAGEREVEVRDLRSRSEVLSALNAAAQGGNPAQVSLSDQLRALRRGDDALNIVPDTHVGITEARTILRAAEQRVATTGNAANAGATVPTTFVARVIDFALAEIGVWQAGPTMLTTGSGEPLTFPRLTAKPTVGPVAENTTFPTTDAAFNQFTLGAHKYGAIVQVSKEMVQDSLIDIAGYVAGQAGTMLGRQIAHDVLLGGGTTTPTGLLTLTTSAGSAAGGANANLITGDDILKLHYSVINTYRRNAAFMMNDATVGQLRGVKDAYGQYLWQPGLVLGAPDMLLGKPVITDPNMPLNGTTGNKFVAFGDFSKYYVRQVNGIQVENSFEYGWGSDLVSYKVTWRGDGNLSDTTGAIKHLLAS